MKEKSTLKDVANNYLTHTKQVKGITLIALVVTIIVLLILSGITFNLIIGENGLFNRAHNATTAWLKAEENEKNLINDLDNFIEQKIGENTQNSGTVDPSNATAETGDVLEGKTFYSGSDEIKTGTMTNNGDWSTSVAAGESVTIPEGYHSGEGHVNVSEGAGDVEITLVDSYSTTREGNLNYSKTISDNSKAVIVMVSGFGASQTQILPNPNISSGTMSVNDFSYFDASSNNSWQNVARVYTITNIQNPFTITFASSSWTWGWGVKLYTVK